MVLFRRALHLMLAFVALMALGNFSCSKGNACRTDRDCPNDGNCLLGSCFVQREFGEGSSREVLREQANESQPETNEQEKYLTKEEVQREHPVGDGRDGGTTFESIEPDTSVEAVLEMTPDATCSSCSWLFLGMSPPQTSGSIDGLRSVQGRSGELYLVLRFHGTISIGGATYSAKGVRDSLLVKLDNQGTFQWAQQWGGSQANFHVVQVKLDSTGASLFLGGTFKGSLLLGSNVLSSVNGTIDSYVARFDLDSKTFTWVHPFGSDTVDALRTIVVDSKDHVHALVYSRGFIKMGKPGPNDPTGTFNDNMMMQFDPKGALLRTFAPQGSDFRVYSLACDAKGNLILAGYVKGSLTFDSTHKVTTGSKVPNVSHLFLGKLDANYKVQWLRSYPTSEFASTIIPESLILSSSKIAVVGSWRGASLFIGTPQELKPVNGPKETLDLFVAEFDLQGKVLQTARWGDFISDYGFAILSNPRGGYYIGGSYGGDAFFSKNKSFSGAKPAIGIDPFALRLNAKLQPTWLVSLPGGSAQQKTGGDMDGIHQLYLDKQGCLIVVGFFRSDATFGCFGQKKLNQGGSVGIFVWKVGSRTSK